MLTKQNSSFLEIAADLQVKVVMDNHMVERLTENEFLWVIKLEAIKKKKNKSEPNLQKAAVLEKMRHALTHKSHLFLYSAIMQLYLQYNVEVWGRTYKKNLTVYTLYKKKQKLKIKLLE